MYRLALPAYERQIPYPNVVPGSDSQYIAELTFPPIPAAGWLSAALERVPPGTRCLLLAADAAGEVLPPAPAELQALVLGRIPILAWFEGELTGPALDLALAADIRLCGAGAALRGPTGWPDRARLLAPRLAPRLAAGERLPAAELLDAGLVTEVSPAGTCLAAARRLAGVLASRGPIALELGKEAIWRGLPQPLEQALRFETDLTMLLQTTKDRAEGVRAFLEKRTPTFTGE